MGADALCKTFLIYFPKYKKQNQIFFGYTSGHFLLTQKVSLRKQETYVDEFDQDRINWKKTVAKGE